MIVDLIYNLSLLVALSVVSGFIGTRWKDRRLMGVLQGFLFGGVVVIAMLNPLVLEPGLIFDGRSVVISLCGLFFGPLAAAVAGGMAVVLRICQGGIGAPTGVAVILASALLGVLFHARWIRRNRDVSSLQLFEFGLLVHVAMLLCLFLMPFDKAVDTLGKIGLLVMLTYPLATVLIGRILSDQTARASFIVTLRDNLEEFRTTLYSIGDAVISTDTAGRIQQMNPVAEKLTGWPEAKAMGKPIGDIFRIINEETRAPVENPVARVLSEGRVVGLANHTRLIARDGRECPIADSAAPIRDAAGNLRGTVLVFRDVTEEYAAAEALRRQEAQLRLLIEHLPQRIFYKDRDSVYIFCNQLYASDLGIRPEEIAGKTDYDFHPQPFAEQYRADDQRIMAANAVTSLEEKYTRGNEERWARTTKVPCHDSAGNLIGIIGIFEDITERRQAEAALQETQAILQAAMDQSQAGIAIADAPSGTLRYVNDAGLLIRGGDRQTVVNGIGVDRYVASWHLLDLDGRPLRSDEVPLARAIMFGETCSREFIIRRAEGDDRIVLARAAPIKDGQGQIKAAVVVFLDITDRKQAEMNLRASERQFRSILETVSLIGVTLDAAGKITFSNDFLLTLTGWKCDEVMGQSWFDLFLPGDIQKHIREDIFLNTIASGEVPAHYENEIVTRAGKRRLVAWNNTIIRNAAGIVTGVACIGEDITNRKQAEAELQCQAEELQASNDELNRFNRAAVDRELRMIEMKQEVNELCRQAGQPPRYPMEFVKK